MFRLSKPAAARALAVLSLVVFPLSIVTPANAGLTLASRGKARCAIYQQPDATAAERHAAQELQTHLNLITGGHFEIRTNASEATAPAIIVGPGPLAAKYFPDANLSECGREELIMRVENGRLLLAGGRPRGTVYAVNRFLQEECGVRWWAPWTTNIPKQASLKIPSLDRREAPAFEYRGPFWWTAFDPLWRSRNCANNENQLIPAGMGGCIRYKGFCHTFYQLVPPEKHFADHPEWFSLIKGKRTHDHAQLCLTNPQLRDFVVQRVKEWLRECPDCEIISVTQNDWNGACECDACKALDDAEGGHSGTMLTFANYIAERIAPEFPNVAVDTFAYTYTRTPPKTLSARTNVIVRLCSIECNFREPLDHPSNIAFTADLLRWSQICNRLYVWDYVTDFSHYVFPHPNWFTLGANMRFFQAHGVKGVFEEGAYAGPGEEMAELRSWVLAQLLWNPQLDDRKLTAEFLAGYYGAAGKPIGKYLELVYKAAEGSYVRCYLSKDPPRYMDFKTLYQAERLWQEAEKAVAKDPELLARVKMAHLPVRCAYLKYWALLRNECWEQNGAWPLPESRRSVADEFRKVCQGAPGKDWTVVKVMSEGGRTVDDFLKPFDTEPELHVETPPPPRKKNPAPPKDLPSASRKGAVDLQDDLARLYQPGKYSDRLPDASASDLRAVGLPGGHNEWAFRIAGEDILAKTHGGKWQVYAVVRVEPKRSPEPNSEVFVAGVYDNASKSYPAQAKLKLEETSNEYHSYLLGTFEPSASRDIFLGPLGNKGIKDIWIDRIYLVPVRGKN